MATKKEKEFQELVKFKEQERVLGRTLKKREIDPNLDPSNYYNGNHLLGHDWAVFHLLYGTGGVGKSYWAMDHVVSAKMRNPDKVQIYWCRLTEESLKGLKDKDGTSFVDAGIRIKFKKDFKVQKNKIYFGKMTTRTNKNGKTITDFEKEGELATFMALSTFFNNKGTAMFDQNFNGKYYFILDEMNREKGEANRFDIIKAFTNQLETSMRNANLKNIKVICIGNNTNEMSDILASFNFIPPAGKYGIWKLKRRRCVIEVIKPSEHYTKTKNQRVGALLNPNDERYAETQKFEQNDLIVDGHTVRTKTPQYIVRFSKKQSDWFTVNKGNLITKYNGEQKEHFGIFRHLDCTYRKEVVDQIQYLHDNLQLVFDNESTCVKFKVSMNKLRAK